MCDCLCLVNLIITGFLGSWWFVFNTLNFFISCHSSWHPEKSQSISVRQYSVLHGIVLSAAWLSIKVLICSFRRASSWCSLNIRRLHTVPLGKQMGICTPDFYLRSYSSSSVYHVFREIIWECLFNADGEGIVCRHMVCEHSFSHIIQNICFTEIV